MDHTIIFQPSGRRARVSEGTTILDAARKLGVGIEAVCGENLVCGKCRVKIMEGEFPKEDITSSLSHLGKVDEKEMKTLKKKEKKENIRLACSTSIMGDVLIFVPEATRTGKQIVSKAAGKIKVKIKPAVKKYYVELPPPSLEDPYGDLERVCDALAKAHGLKKVSIDYRALQVLPDVLRTGDWKVTVTVWQNHEIIRVESGRVETNVGLAVDIGTTTVAGYLTDLNTGEVLATESMMNPQVSYGEDVMSRITYCMLNEEDGLKELQETIVEGLNTIAKNAAKRVDLAPEDISEMTIVGNTAMHHLLAGLPVRQLAMAPYVPAVGEALDLPVGEIELDINPGAFIHLPPNIAGFIGADHISMMLSTDVWQKEDNVIALDIGTNTEITLAVGGRMLSCSCASGPAFEGAHIRDGMRAAPGAIERVQIKNGQPNIYTIGEKSPVGICGSGILDAVAELLKDGIIDHRGSFQEGAPNVREGMSTQQKEFLLVPSKDTGHGKDIAVTRSDINEIQLAKSAIRSGLEILLEEGGIAVGDIEEFIIAGAFGTYLDVGSAMTIGMFPELPRDRFRQVGNAAGTGAQQMLISAERRRVADEISERVEYIELTTHAGFEKAFMKALFLDP